MLITKEIFNYIANMCGRKTLTKNKRAIIEELMIDDWQIEDYLPSYNISPTQHSIVMIQANGSNIAKRMKWGLIPNWSKNDSFSSKMINARLETLRSKPSFKDLIYKKRCIVPSNGYYEWKQNGPNKNAYFINRKDNRLLLFAGLWTLWPSPSGSVYTYTIITTKAQQDIAHIHNRMPVILDKSKIDKWINIENRSFEIQEAISQSKESLDHYQVSNFVNSPNNNSKRCITPFKEPVNLNLFDNK